MNAPAEILDRQRAYVRQVVDTVNDLDNVLYEIGNEMCVGSVEWFDPKTGTAVDGAVDGQPVKASEQATFTPPFSGDAVLYLKAQ